MHDYRKSLWRPLADVCFLLPLLTQWASSLMQNADLPLTTPLKVSEHQHVRNAHAYQHVTGSINRFRCSALPSLAPC